MINLTESQRYSETWLIIKAHLNESLEKLHRDNEKMGNTIEQTAAIRGQIKLIRELLKSPADKLKSTDTDKYR